MRRKTWVKLPTYWIEQHRLKEFRWDHSEGSSATAALMVLMVLAHEMNEDSGVVRVTYDTICEATNLSRTKVAHGLRYLEMKQLIGRQLGKNSVYQIAGYPLDRPWGKLPCHGLYQGNVIAAFKHFKMRSRTELDALKLYFLFVSRRNKDINATQISYDKITEYTAIDRNRIKSAVSFLIFQHLVNVETEQSRRSLFGMSHIYRLTHIDPRFDPRAYAEQSDLASLPDDTTF